MKNTKSGFTLPELLVVVAIIAVLVAIAIPVFSAQLESSKQASDLSNIRAAYAEATADAITQGGKDGVAETGIMKHTGVFDKLGEATIGNLDLKTSDADPVVKDYSVIVTVSAKDGSVSLSVGNGGFVLGKVATQEELNSIGRPYNYNDRSYDNVYVNGNVLLLVAKADHPYWYPMEKSVTAEYGVPSTICGNFSDGKNYYYTWDGARWYVVDQPGDKWEKAVTEKHGH